MATKKGVTWQDKEKTINGHSITYKEPVALSDTFFEKQAGRKAAWDNVIKPAIEARKGKKASSKKASSKKAPAKKASTKKDGSSVSATRGTKKGGTKKKASSKKSE